MGFVLGVAATKGSALLKEFNDAALADEDIRDFQKRAQMKWDVIIE